jgi:hypothetical protein
MLEKLYDYFDASEIKFKPAVFSQDKSRAMALAYIDARCVMDRLDEVVGPENWQDEYQVLPDGSVLCKLSLNVPIAGVQGGHLLQWITKSDVGGQSEQADEGDRIKAAVSDALKRAAVKWGIGRYLYSMPRQWVGYDNVRKQFTDKPVIPAMFLPKQENLPDQKEIDEWARNLDALDNTGEALQAMNDSMPLYEKLDSPTKAVVRKLIWDRCKKLGWTWDAKEGEWDMAKEVIT